jgi:monoamine oxidase
MSVRTPLLQALASALRTAAKSEASSDSSTLQFDRRTFLKGYAAAAISIASGGTIASCGLGLLKRSDVRVAIVGGGLAGLTCAYELKKDGITAQIYEASTRLGGRVFTARDLMGSGFTTELGGEFIDSTHEELLALARELEIGILDRDTNTYSKHTFFFEGEHRTIEQVAKALAPALKNIREDYSSLPSEINYRTTGRAAQLDLIPLSSYIAQFPADDWIKKALNVAYVTEFGLDTTEQSALNLLTMLGPMTTEFNMYGESDKRFRINGGNSVLTRELTARLQSQIQTGMMLTRLEEKGGGYDLTFTQSGASKIIHADAVILAIPFTMLRGVDLKIELPQIKRRAIDELGYGTHTKLMIGMKRRVWQHQGSNGYVFSDQPFQVGWDNTEFQPGENGGYTALLAGTTGLEANKPNPRELADQMLPGLSQCFPGFSHWTNGKYERFHWASYQFTHGSYACYKTGQWTTIAGAEIEPVNRVFFAGEHTSAKHQGFMNGAVETGVRAARSVLSLVKT